MTIESPSALRSNVNNAQVWIFLGIEHGMLLFKYLLETLINDTPADVGIQLKRNEFIVSKVGEATPTQP